MATKNSRPRLGFLIAAAFALSATVLPNKAKAADFFYDNQGGTALVQTSIIGTRMRHLAPVSGPPPGSPITCISAMVLLRLETIT